MRLGSSPKGRGHRQISALSGRSSSPFLKNRPKAAYTVTTVHRFFELDALCLYVVSSGHANVRYDNLYDSLSMRMTSEQDEGIEASRRGFEDAWTKPSSSRSSATSGSGQRLEERSSL